MARPSFHDVTTLEPPTNQLLRGDDYVSASEHEKSSDHEGGQRYNNLSGDDADEVVGFSIGQRQSYMKSAQTPAAEKVQAIDNNAKDYFDIRGVDGAAEEPGSDRYTSSDQPTASPVQQSPPRLGRLTQQELQGRESPPSQWNPGQAFQQRSAATRSFLADGITNLRRRASSGPSSLTDNIRRIISDLPAMGFPKNTLSMSPSRGRLNDDGDLNQGVRATRSSTGISKGNVPAWEISPLNEQHLNRRESSLTRTVTTSSQHDGTPNRQLLRRSTSDNSLYLRRGLSHTTTLDDTTKWDNVSEQVNSRFKAITDSFQDSRIRMPKVPSLNFSSFRPGTSERYNGDDVKDIARMNRSERMKSRSSQTLSTFSGNANNAKRDPSAEHHAHPVMAQALSELTGDVIVLGGYRGSILRSARPPHRQLWVPVKVGLNLRKVDLEVGLNPEDEETMEETIFASGVLSHIGPVDICRRLLRHLRKCHNTKSKRLRVHDYGYDWRLSPHLSSRKFLEFVEKLHCNQPGTPPHRRGVTVIAHSLGGLITRHAVNIKPDLFAGVVYAGTPQNCVNILGPLRNGDAVLLSSRVLTAQVNFSMRTSFALLPEDGRCFINKNTGERYDVDFFDVKTWDEYRLSPCIKPPLQPTPLQDHRKSLIGVLSDSLPSLPNSAKRGSWGFGNSKDTSPDRLRDSNSSVDRVKDAKDGAADTADNIANAASDMLNADASPPNFEPSMGQSYNSGSISTTCTIPRDVAGAYLTRTLAETKVFKQQLAFRSEHEASNAYPPLAYMFCKGVPTVYGARVASREAIKYTDAFDELAFAAGDGVVLASAAMLPKGYRCVRGGKVESERGHVGLLGDVEGVGKALMAIMEARAKGVGLGPDAEFFGRRP